MKQTDPNSVDFFLKILDEEVERLNNQLKEIRRIMASAEKELSRLLTGG